MASGGVTPGGGGGPAAGSYLPTADSVAFTVDNTTYNNPISGSGKLTTLVFTGSKAALAIAKSGDAFPRWLWAADGRDGFYFGPGNYDAYAAGGPLFYSGSTGSFNIAAAPANSISLGSPVNGQPASTPGQLPVLSQVSPLFGIISGALPTVALVSATGTQIPTIGSLRDTETITPVTFNPGAATTATCKAELSPDDVTYSTLGTETEPVGVALDGTIHLIKVRVPAGWYIKLTVTNATLGTTTYY